MNFSATIVKHFEYFKILNTFLRASLGRSFAMYLFSSRNDKKSINFFLFSAQHALCNFRNLPVICTLHFTLLRKERIC